MHCPKEILIQFYVDNGDENMLTYDGFEKKASPVWSHDGSRIAYTKSGFESQLAVLELTGLTKTIFNVPANRPGHKKRSTATMCQFVEKCHCPTSIVDWYEF